MELSQFDKQLIKFSKWHYSNYEHVDLNVLVAHHLGLYVEQVTTPMSMRLVIKTYEKLVHMQHIRNSYEDTFNVLLRRNLYYGGDGMHITRDNIIDAFIAEISSIAIKDPSNGICIDLGELSPEIIQWGVDKRERI